jgi:hypothetical protein
MTAISLAVILSRATLPAAFGLRAAITRLLLVHHVDKSTCVLARNSWLSCPGKGLGRRLDEFGRCYWREG